MVVEVVVMVMVVVVMSATRGRPTADGGRQGGWQS